MKKRNVIKILEFLNIATTLDSCGLKGEKDFDLEVILSFITGIKLVDDFKECYKLLFYIYDDKYINYTGLVLLKDEVRNHLLAIYPKLKDVKYNSFKDGNVDDWIVIQKLTYGESLPVSKIGCALSFGARKRAM